MKHTHREQMGSVTGCVDEPSHADFPTTDRIGETLPAVDTPLHIVGPFLPPKQL
jgi:hypothetical protein